MSTQAIAHPGQSKQRNLLLTKGILQLVWGFAVLLFSSVMGYENLIFSFGLVNLFASILTFTYSRINRHLRISHQWLLLEGLIELAAAVVFMFFVKDIRQYTLWMGYGMIFIIFLEFIYGYGLTTTNKVNIGNMASRFAFAIAGTVIAIILIGNIIGLQWSLILIGIFSMLFGALNSHFAVKYRNIILGKTE
jgi:hypothetical protein